MDRRQEKAERLVGTVLRERWTIDALIGVGGMAAVYKATHRNGNEVAIKMLHPDVSDDEGIRKRFQREGYVANRVKHRGAVTVYDDDVTEDGAAFLVMELLSGENIETRRERLGGFVPLPEVLGIADQVLDVLAAAHSQGIVHRDIKPENLFLTTEGVVKVLDFGIARLRSSQYTTSLTMVGAMLGTPGFLAPEQARGMTQAVDAQTDLWAVGATMFTLLSGRHVQDAATAEESTVLAATTPARSLAKVLPDLDRGVVALVDRALAWEKRDRWPDAKSMQHELRSVASRVLGSDAKDAKGLELEPSGALSSPIISSEREPPTRVMELPEPKAGAGLGGVPFSEEPSTRRQPVRVPEMPAAGAVPPPRPQNAFGGVPPVVLAAVAAVVLFIAFVLALVLVAAIFASARMRS
ncbi:MAG: serine/threonine-protein kinase [Polyangiaceae bacterium]